MLNHPESRTPFLREIVLCALLSILFSIFVVQYSLKEGKLAFPPWYDDSHSMVEGALRLMTLQQEGVSAAWDEYLARPPHSFMHYYWTSILYGVFGIDDRVVYWGNSVFLFAALFLFSLLLGRLGLGKILYLMSFLLVPVAFNIIYDYRSECALAPLLFAASTLMVFAVLEPHQIWKCSILSGIFFALGFGIKPAMFPYTFGMMGAACLVWVLFTPEWRNSGINFWAKISRIFAPAVGLVFLAVIPFAFHYWINRASIWGYIDSIAFKSEFYSQGGDFWSQATYHLSGFPAMLNLGIYKWPLLVMAGLAVIGAVFAGTRGDQRFSAAVKGLFFLTCCSYLGIAVNRMVQNYFCMTFDLLLAATAFVGLAWAASILPQKIRAIPVVVVTIVFLALWRVPVSQDYVAETAKLGEGAVQWRKEAPERVLDVILDQSAKGTTPVVWCGFHGWLDGNTLSWEAINRGLKWRCLSYYERPPTTPGHPPSGVDFVVMGAPGLMGMSDLPLNPGLSEMIANIEGDPAWTKLQTIPDPKGNNLIIYKKTAL